MYFNNRYFTFYIENPLRTWWKARRFFKRPRICFYKLGRLIPKTIHTKYGDYEDDGLSNYPSVRFPEEGKILKVHSFDVQWKSKYDSPRHESNPLICVLFFNRIGFFATFNVTYLNELGEVKFGDMEYWEFLLDFLYFHKNLKDALIASNGWTYDSKIWKMEKCPADEKEVHYEPYKCILQTQLFSLNKRGFLELQKDFNKPSK